MRWSRFGNPGKCGTVSFGGTREGDKNRGEGGGASWARQLDWPGVRCALIKAAQEAICVNSGRRAEVKRQQTQSAKHVKVAAEWEEPDIREVTVLKEPLCR